MSKLYTQCHLVKGNTHQTAWLDAEKAKLGAVVEVKSEKPGEREGWKIESMGGQTTEEFLALHYVSLG